MSDNLTNAIIGKCLQILVDSDSSSDDDDYVVDIGVLSELGLVQDRKKRKCIQNFIEIVLTKYEDSDFLTNFRVNKKLFFDLVEKFRQSSDFLKLSVHSQTISPEKHIAIFLWFSGHEACCYRDIGNRFDVTISTVFEVIKRVTFFVSDMFQDIIKWPNEEEKKMSSDYFKSKGFPNVIGCIGGTRIIIDPPSRNKHEYIDRNDNTSIAFQGICNHNKKFIDVFVGLPGSVHDSQMFKDSEIYHELPSLCEGYYLLGDSAYPCKRFLMTPYKDNGELLPHQTNYNKLLSSNRVCIEHTIGMLKQRFPQLYHCKFKDIQMLCHFIRACCVLHNICGVSDFSFIEEQGEDDIFIDMDIFIDDDDDSTGVQLRNELSIEFLQNK